MTFPGQQIKKNELLFQAPVLNRCQDAVFALCRFPVVLWMLEDSSIVDRL
jgi:uncharacterized protein (UPF0305 family)